MNNILDQIMGVQEAGELWGISHHHVKRLCRDGDVVAKRIGNSWVIDKNQPNPRGGNKVAKVFYEDIEVGTITTNQSLTVEEALNLIDFDEQEFIKEQGFDDIDYNDFKLVY